MPGRDEGSSLRPNCHNSSFVWTGTGGFKLSADVTETLACLIQVNMYSLYNHSKPNMLSTLNIAGMAYRNHKKISSSKEQKPRVVLTLRP